MSGGNTILNTPNQNNIRGLNQNSSNQRVHSPTFALSLINSESSPEHTDMQIDHIPSQFIDTANPSIFHNFPKF